MEVKKRILKNKSNKPILNVNNITKEEFVEKIEHKNQSDEDDSDDNKSVFDADIQHLRRNEQLEEEEDAKTPFQTWKDKMFVKFSCKIHQLEFEDMQKEDININKFYQHFDLIKETLNEMYQLTKEYKELDFNGIIGTYQIQRKNYELEVKKCNAYLDLIREETKDKLLTTREQKTAKREYNTTTKELKGLKEVKENGKIEKIIKYRKLLYYLIEEKKKFLIQNFNIHFDPFVNRLNS